jgi:hypothetical protein
VKRSFPVVWDSVPAASGPHDCFADEIAIDFPSVDQFVQRVREGFLEERGDDMLTTEVSLSRHDASFGVIIPLEVPLRGTCAHCGGRGETWAEPCAECCGTGHLVAHQPIRVTVPPGVGDGACFRFRVRSPHAGPLRVEVRIRLADTR